VIENFAPRSGLFAADIFPPCRSMMERQIDRPIPSASGLLVMKGSKIDSSFSAAMPVVLNFDQHVRLIVEGAVMTRRVASVREFGRRGPSLADKLHDALKPQVFVRNTSGVKGI